MDRQEMVRELTKRGIIVTPEIMRRIAESGIDVVLDAGATPRTKPKLSVRIRRTVPLKKLSTQDFISYYNSRYSGLRDLLLKKMDAVSINKAMSGLSGVSVIGMVREKAPRGFTLEDSTGEIDVVSGEEVRQDDVVGIRGVVRENKLFQSEIVWPDVPLTNGHKPVPGLSILLATKLDETLTKTIDDFNVVFLTNNDPITASQSKVLGNIPNPCFATINKGEQEFRVLVYRPTEPIPPEEAVALLRRRHLLPKREEISTKEDPYLIDPVPNLFWVISDRRHVERYKGVTMIMSARDDAVKFDAETQKVYFAYDAPASTKPVGV